VNLEEEAQRYTELLKENGIDIACVGIGENGHLAFNDSLTVKVVELDGVCRQQQVNDGCFGSIDKVPSCPALHYPQTQERHIVP